MSLAFANEVPDNDHSFRAVMEEYSASHWVPPEGFLAGIRGPTGFSTARRRLRSPPSSLDSDSSDVDMEHAANVVDRFMRSLPTLDPEDFEDFEDFDPEDLPECGICKESYNSGKYPEVQLPCGHIFDKFCLKTLITSSQPRVNNSCPMCRTELFQRDGKAISDHDDHGTSDDDDDDDGISDDDDDGTSDDDDGDSEEDVGASEEIESSRDADESAAEEDVSAMENKPLMVQTAKRAPGKMLTAPQKMRVLCKTKTSRKMQTTKRTPGKMMKSPIFLPRGYQ